MLSTSTIKLTLSDSSTTSECQIHSLLCKSKFDVYKVSLNGKLYALKLFPFNNFNYLIESSFTSLSHPNILTPAYFGTFEDDSLTKHSIILSEYCPHETFFEFLQSNKVKFCEKMTRTYFRQLVDAIEYLHRLRIAHLDLKLENLFMDSEFNLRLGDYDLSYHKDRDFLTEGTENFRAPEMINKTRRYDPFRAEIYSLGVVLFTVHNGARHAPFYEQYPQIRRSFEKNPSTFWNYMKKVLGEGEDFWSPEFKDLFQKMTCADPYDRLTLEEIKESDWYKGDIYTQEEVKNIMRESLKEDAN